MFAQDMCDWCPVHLYQVYLLIIWIVPLIGVSVILLDVSYQFTPFWDTVEQQHCNQDDSLVYKGACGMMISIFLISMFNHIKQLRDASTVSSNWRFLLYQFITVDCVCILSFTVIMSGSGPRVLMSTGCFQTIHFVEWQLTCPIQVLSLITLAEIYHDHTRPKDHDSIPANPFFGARRLHKMFAMAVNSVMILCGLVLVAYHYVIALFISMSCFVIHSVIVAGLFRAISTRGKADMLVVKFSTMFSFLSWVIYPVIVICQYYHQIETTTGNALLIVADLLTKVIYVNFNCTMLDVIVKTKKDAEVRHEFCALDSGLASLQDRHEFINLQLQCTIFMEEENQLMCSILTDTVSRLKARFPYSHPTVFTSVLGLQLAHTLCKRLKCGENTMFLACVRWYRDCLEDDTGINEKAALIVDYFIREDSPHQINIADVVAKTIIQKSTQGQADATLFNDAESTIRKLVSSNLSLNRRCISDSPLFFAYIQLMKHHGTTNVAKIN